MPSVGPSPYPEQLRPVLNWSPNSWNPQPRTPAGASPGIRRAGWPQSVAPQSRKGLENKSIENKSAEKHSTKRRPLDAILWWEIRRILFNLVLLAAGTVSLVLIFLVLSWLPSATDGAQSVFAIFMYIISANAIYTLGWISELLWSGGDTALTAKVRPRVFRMGLIFSAGITLLPAVLAPAIWVLWGYR